MKRVGLLIACLAVIPAMNACSETATNSNEQSDSELTADPTLPDGVLNAQSLVRYAMAYTAYSPKDQFAPQQFDDSKLVGRKIHIEQRYFAGIPHNQQTIFSYDVEAQELTFSVTPPVGIASITNDLGTQKGTNAFGATADVKMNSTEMFFVGFTPVSAFSSEAEKPIEAIGVFPIKKHEEGIGRTTYFYDEVSKTIKMSPDAARKLTDGLSLIIDATATRGKSGHAVECNTDYKTATIDSPTQGATTRCTIIVKFNKVAIASADGKNLAEWK